MRTNRDWDTARTRGREPARVPPSLETAGACMGFQYEPERLHWIINLESERPEPLAAFNVRSAGRSKRSAERNSGRPTISCRTLTWRSERLVAVIKTPVVVIARVARSTAAARGRRRGDGPMFVRPGPRENVRPCRRRGPRKSAEARQQADHRPEAARPAA